MMLVGMDEDEFTAKDRFLRLPDDPVLRDRVLRVVQRIDPEARVHNLSPPTGTVIEVHNAGAWMAARMLGCDANEFSLR